MNNTLSLPFTQGHMKIWDFWEVCGTLKKRVTPRFVTICPNNAWIFWWFQVPSFKTAVTSFVFVCSRICVGSFIIAYSEAFYLKQTFIKMGKSLSPKFSLLNTWGLDAVLPDPQQIQMNLQKFLLALLAGMAFGCSHQGSKGSTVSADLKDPHVILLTWGFYALELSACKLPFSTHWKRWSMTQRSWTRRKWLSSWSNP